MPTFHVLSRRHSSNEGVAPGGTLLLTSRRMRGRPSLRTATQIFGRRRLRRLFDAEWSNASAQVGADRILLNGRRVARLLCCR